MTDNEAETPTPSNPRRRRLAGGRTSRLPIALLAVATASMLALMFTIGSAGAQSSDSMGVTQGLQSAGGQSLIQAHHEEAIPVHHEGETRHHEDGERRGGKCGHRAAVTAAAELLGMEPEALRDRMMDGETLAEIAASEGVETSEVIDAIVNAISNHAAEHDHEIDTESLTERVTALVNGQHPERGDGKRGWHGRRGLHRLGGHIGSHSSVSTA